MKIDDKLNNLKNEIPNMNPNLDEIIIEKYEKSKNKPKISWTKRMIVLASPMFLLLLVIGGILMLKPNGGNVFNPTTSTTPGASTVTNPTTSTTAGAATVTNPTTPNSSPISTLETPTISKPLDYIYNSALVMKKQDKASATGVIYEEGFKNFCKKLADFGLRLSELYYKNNIASSFSVSPISITNLLGLTIECSNNETKDEILNAIGVSYSEVLTYYPELQRYINKEIISDGVVTTRYESNNSIWYDDDVVLNENTLKSLSENYYCDNFQIDFSKNPTLASNDINHYISEKTYGLIKPNLNFSNDTIMCLLNTIYVEEIWTTSGAISSSQREFTNRDNTKTTTNFLFRGYVNSTIGDSDKMEFFYANTNSNFRLYFMLPKEDYSVDDIYNYESIRYMLDYDSYKLYDNELREKYLSAVRFPSFDVSMTSSITRELKQIGINSIFSNSADFTNITNSKCYASSILHESRFIVDEKGIKGAAYSVEPAPGANLEEYTIVKRILEINKPFGYVLIDENGSIVFTGVINKL